MSINSAGSASTRKADTNRPGTTANRKPQPSITDRLIRALQGRKGATMEQMVALTGWQAHSVRGMLSRVLRKKHSLDVVCTASASGERCYRIVGKAVP